MPNVLSHKQQCWSKHENELLTIEFWDTIQDFSCLVSCASPIVGSTAGNFIAIREAARDQRLLLPYSRGVVQDGAALARLISLVGNHERAIYASTGTRRREQTRWAILKVHAALLQVDRLG